jgi:hypothetical protein
MQPDPGLPFLLMLPALVAIAHSPGHSAIDFDLID